MSDRINDLLTDIRSKDYNIRLSALNRLLEITEERVDWFEEKFEELVGKMDHENSYQRSIGIMLLCSLAKSDENDRIPAVVGEILKHTRDERFITARQCIQHLWKIGIAKPETKKEIIDHLGEQFVSCAQEKHHNLIRQDIIQTLYRICCHDSDEGLKGHIIDLIEKEEDEKARKNYFKIIK